MLKIKLGEPFPKVEDTCVTLLHVHYDLSFMNKSDIKRGSQGTNYEGKD